MKNRILWRYGKCDEKPIDWQRIIRYCWSCEGTGEKYHPYDCWKCGGSGIYSEKWILLTRYCIAGRVFHVPGDALFKKPEFVEKPDISGYVQHKKSKYAWHCQATLALLFDWKLAKDLIADALVVRKWKNTARNLYNIARRCCICRKSVGKRAYVESGEECYCSAECYDKAIEYGIVDVPF